MPTGLVSAPSSISSTLAPLVSADNPPGHPLREGLPSALEGHGAESIQVKFRPEGGGYRLVSYRLTPSKQTLPADRADQLHRLAHASINRSLPLETAHLDKKGTRTWQLDTDRMEIR